MGKKTFENYYHQGKKLLSKNVIAAIVICAAFATILGLFTMRPEIFYLCTIILIISVITVIIDNRAMNSMSIAAVPLFIIVIPLQPSFGHIFIGVLTIIILFRNGKNSIPWLIVVTSIFYVFYGVMLTRWIIWSPDDILFYQALLSPGQMIFYFTSIIMIAGIIRSLQPKKRRK